MLYKSVTLGKYRGMVTFKGTWFAFWSLSFGTMVYLYFALFSNSRPHTATGMSALTGYTLANPIWWIALIICLVVGNAIAKYWPVPRFVWIASLVSGAIPAGLILLILVLATKVALRNRI